jgi:hypothetical protein
MTRDRRSSFVGFAWLSLAVGIALLVVAAAGDQDSGAAIGTAIAGAALVGVGILSMLGVLGTATAAAIGFFGGVLLTVVAFSAPDFGVAQAVLLLAGAITFIGSFASLASSRRLAAGRGESEPGPGVESV